MHNPYSLKLLNTQNIKALYFFIWGIETSYAPWSPFSGNQQLKEIWEILLFRLRYKNFIHSWSPFTGNQQSTRHRRRDKHPRAYVRADPYTPYEGIKFFFEKK